MLVCYQSSHCTVVRDILVPCISLNLYIKCHICDTNEFWRKHLNGKEMSKILKTGQSYLSSWYSASQELHSSALSPASQVDPLWYLERKSKLYLLSIGTGVLQGLMLGPLLFLIYTTSQRHIIPMEGFVLPLLRRWHAAHLFVPVWQS